MIYLEITPKVTAALGFYNDVPDEKIEITLVEWKKKEGDEIGGEFNPHTGVVTGDWIAEFDSEKGKVSLFAIEDWLHMRIVSIAMRNGEVQHVNFRRESLRLAIIEPIGGEKQKNTEANQRAEESVIAAGGVDNKTPQVAPTDETNAEVHEILHSEARAEFGPDPKECVHEEHVEHFAATGLDALPASTTDNGQKMRVSPLARRLAKQLGVDISRVRGSGARGVIIPSDVEKAAHMLSPARTTLQESAEENELLPIGDLPYEVIVPSKLRLATARGMKRSRESTVIAGGDIEINPQPLLAFIEKHRAAFARMHSGIKLRIDYFVAAACVSLLREEEFRNLNAYWDDETENIRHYKRVNMGIAVSVPPNGKDSSSNLIVPNVKHAESLRFPDFVKEAERVIEIAKTGSPNLADVIGSTFVVDNAGIPVKWRSKLYPGIDHPSPVIMSRTGAILALGRWREKKNGKKKKMWLVLRIDHQLADGVDASKFLRALEERLACPEQILLL